MFEEKGLPYLLEEEDVFEPNEDPVAGMLRSLNFKRVCNS
jgi:hypothetical protein